jgi:tripartite-type tricarboxylate transporter receptor subunit TctC
MPTLRVLLVIAAATVLAPATASCENWPSRPIRILVPFPAGGSTDVAARIIGEHLSRSLGQQVFIENKSGANGNLGIEAAAKSAPDGYTILVGTDATSSNPHVYKMSIDVLTDLVPVVELSRQPLVLAAHPSLGVKSLADLIALAKQQPGLRYATGSGFGAQHMVVQWFARIADIKLEHVPYRGGGPAINDLIGGHVKLGSLGSSPLIPHYKAGTLRLLAQSSLARRACPTFRPIRRRASRASCSTSGSAYSSRPGRRRTSRPASIARSTKRSPIPPPERTSSRRARSRSAARPTNSLIFSATISRSSRGW